MTTITEAVPDACASRLPADGEPNHEAGSSAYDERIAAITAAYHRTVDHIMTTQYGPDWATRGDLPDAAYTTETVFHQWLNDLLDHIDGAAMKATPRSED